VQFMSLMRSMNHRHVEIDHDAKMLHLRYGFFAESSIPFAAITEIEKHKKSLPADKSVLKFSPMDMLDSHNVILRLSMTHILHKIYGMKKDFQNIAIFIDDREKFISQLEEALSSNKEPTV